MSRSSEEWVQRADGGKGANFRVRATVRRLGARTFTRTPTEVVRLMGAETFLSSFCKPIRARRVSPRSGEIACGLSPASRRWSSMMGFCGIYVAHTNDSQRASFAADAMLLRCAHD